MNFLYHEKTVNVFLNVDRYKNIQRLSRDLDVTYSHVTKVIKLFWKNGFIETQKVGRENKIKLTSEGREIRKNLLEIKGLIL